jgi:hypothetical protein
MKYLFPIIFLLFTINLSSDEVQWVDEQIKAIKPPREGVSDANISRLKDPFIFKNVSSSKNGVATVAKSSKSLKYKSVKKYRKLILKTIINQSAMINGKWYKINDKVGYYTLSEIKRTSVTLSYKSKKLILSVASKNKNLKFKDK